MAVRMNVSRGQVRHGLNAVLLFCLMIACLHLYTLRQRMHQLERKMTVVKHGADIVRRSLQEEDGPESYAVSDGLDTHDSSVQIRTPLHVRGGEENDEDVSVADSSSGSVQASELQGEDDNGLVDKPRSTLLKKRKRNRKNLKTPSLPNNKTPAPTPAPTKPPVQATTTTTTTQKPATTAPSVHSTTQPPEAIVNPHNFSFIINNPDKCGNENVLLLILVTTTAQAKIQRETIRRTWGNESNIAGVVIKTVFAIGHTDDMKAQNELEQESIKHKDIIQEDFVDSYHNLTLKTVMTWKWAFQYCPKARFVMKADDDTFVNIFSIVKHLIGMQKHAAKRYVTGWVYMDAKPVRDPMSEWNKWYVKYEDYPRDSYPNYPCGFAYIISNDITQALYETSETIKYLFLEDAFLGLCMEKLGIEPVHHGGFCPWYSHIDSCQFDWLMASHWVKRYEDMWYLWNTLTSC